LLVGVVMQMPIRLPPAVDPDGRSQSRRDAAPEHLQEIAIP
jgi:hypothetical protein